MGSPIGRSSTGAPATESPRSTPHSPAKHSLKALARRWRHLDTEVAPPTTPLARRPHRPSVADTTRRIRNRSRPGGGDPHRVRRQPRTDPLRSRILRNSAAPAPSPLSSGQTNRHRLYRGGHHQANAALYQLAIVRMRFHQPTIDYVARRTTESLPRKGHYPLPQTVPRPRGLPTRNGRPPNPKPHPPNQYLIIGASTL